LEVVVATGIATALSASIRTAVKEAKVKLMELVSSTLHGALALLAELR
jgi:hypothetical protein